MDFKEEEALAFAQNVVNEYMNNPQANERIERIFYADKKVKNAYFARHRLMLWPLNLVFAPFYIIGSILQGPCYAATHSCLFYEIIKAEMRRTMLAVSEQGIYHIKIEIQRTPRYKAWGLIPCLYKWTPQNIVFYSFRNLPKILPMAPDETTGDDPQLFVIQMIPMAKSFLSVYCQDKKEAMEYIQLKKGQYVPDAQDTAMPTFPGPTLPKGFGGMNNSLAPMMPGMNNGNVNQMLAQMNNPI